MKKLPVVKAFDSIAGEWNAKHSKPRPWVVLFKKFLKKSDVILDAGCGNGINAIALAPFVEKTYAVDASPRMVSFAKSNVLNYGLQKKILVSKASILALPFADSSFDSVAYFAVIHHFAKPNEWKKIFSEMRRVLKPKGLAFVTVWNKLKGLETEPKVVFLGFPKKNGERVPRMHYFFEEGQLTCLAEESGFIVEEVFYERNGEKTTKGKGRNLCLVLSKPKSPY